MQTGSDPLIKFYYDANGKRTHFDYLGSAYYYLYNIQGDVIALTEVNNVGGSYVYQTVCEYRYDSWGNIENVTTNSAYTKKNPAVVAEVNPFRYRGYMYDTETNLYYLQSRYYNPEWCRFINADGRLTTSLGVLGMNMFAYCKNNPINKADYTGNKPFDLFNTADEAAEDFARTYNAESISAKQEYGSAIYRIKIVSYVITTKDPTKPLSILNFKIAKIVTYFYYYNDPVIGKKGNSVTPNVFPNGDTLVATVHTHANYSYGQYNDENFSDGAGSDLWWSNLFHMNSYVVTPGGYLKKYTYNNKKDANGGVTILASDIPWDPNYPYR
jgi:RHS repeat-associated protein